MPWDFLMKKLISWLKKGWRLVFSNWWGIPQYSGHSCFEAVAIAILPHKYDGHNKIKLNIISITYSIICPWVWYVTGDEWRKCQYVININNILFINLYILLSSPPVVCMLILYNSICNCVHSKGTMSHLALEKVLKVERRNSTLWAWET